MTRISPEDNRPANPPNHGHMITSGKSDSRNELGVDLMIEGRAADAQERGTQERKKFIE